MPAFLPVRLNSETVSVAICDRCRAKVYHDDLVPDGDSPGLRVCMKCRDEEDPYKLPPRAEERISIPYPRPDDFPTV